MVKKLAEETQKAVEEAEAAAEESGTANPALEPDKSKMPLPGTTGDLDVMTTDEATSLNPNVTVSGTKPDGEGGQVLLDTVDPAVANAALLGPTVARKPQSPSEPPQDGGPKMGPNHMTGKDIPSGRGAYRAGVAVDRDKITGLVELSKEVESSLSSFLMSV